MPRENAIKKILQQRNINHAKVDTGALATLPLHSVQKSDEHAVYAQQLLELTLKISIVAAAPQLEPLPPFYCPDRKARFGMIRFSQCVRAIFRLLHNIFSSSLGPLSMLGTERKSLPMYRSPYDQLQWLQSMRSLIRKLHEL